MMENLMMAHICCFFVDECNHTRWFTGLVIVRLANLIQNSPSEHTVPFISVAVVNIQ